ncbi:hypothetical protein M595_4825 [Lyngbya aestuarii BL J]|uniref:Uncharacterized protein n=1 Tax=Lyngbya aestuarii BL J TaxID=1348334 RepID=U7QFJ6_9CYAN|nr:hypothetical protein M595_4825 [Lyngbya aestuarii BL J]
MLSFWCIYEVGYIENDRVAERFEKSPVLSETYSLYRKEIKLGQPWIWAGIFAIPGLILLNYSDDCLLSLDLPSPLFSGVINITLWFGFLLLVRTSYWMYNHIDKQTRVGLYLILQIYKTFGFLLITTTNLVGIVL